MSFGDAVAWTVFLVFMGVGLYALGFIHAIEYYRPKAPPKVRAPGPIIRMKDDPHG